MHLGIIAEGIRNAIELDIIKCTDYMRSLRFLRGIQKQTNSYFGHKYE